MATEQAPRIAVLVDADNAQASKISKILSEVARYGAPTVKRAYGDWTTPNLSAWKDGLLVHAIQPIQQFRYTTGKNATDSAMIIDAMDLLHGGKIDGFCIVSSDSDFTRLATRIRESGASVYGIGEQKTPKPFVAACDKFIFTEILDAEQSKKTPPKVNQARVKDLLIEAISGTVRDDGWAPLAAIGSWLTANDPSFDARNYGHKKLSDMVRSQPFIEIEERSAPGDSNSKNMFVRSKEA